MLDVLALTRMRTYMAEKRKNMACRLLMSSWTRDQIIGSREGTSARRRTGATHLQKCLRRENALEYY